jgi:hypothetical protein
MTGVINHRVSRAATAFINYFWRRSQRCSRIPIRIRRSTIAAVAVDPRETSVVGTAPFERARDSTEITDSRMLRIDANPGSHIGYRPVDPVRP